MPLKKGKSKQAFSYNVKELVSSGRKPSQAVAIAYSVAGENKKEQEKKKKKKKY